MKNTARQLDLVLIDDDPLVQEIWAIAADEAGCSLLVLDTPDGLENHSVDRSRPIFIDLNLGAKLEGMRHLDRLHGHGFESLYITTGDEPTLVPKRTYLKGIIGKDFPALTMLADSEPTTGGENS